MTITKRELIKRLESMGGSDETPIFGMEIWGEPQQVIGVIKERHLDAPSAIWLQLESL